MSLPHNIAVSSSPLYHRGEHAWPLEWGNRDRVEAPITHAGQQLILCVVKQSVDGLWYVVSSDTFGDKYWEDLGPYDTPELALTVLRLHGELK